MRVLERLLEGDGYQIEETYTNTNFYQKMRYFEVLKQMS